MKGLTWKFYLSHFCFICYNRELLIKKRKKNASKDFIQNQLPELSTHLELRLYRNASTLKEYSNLTTLSSRLINIVNEVHEMQMTKMLNDAKI